MATPAEIKKRKDTRGKKKEKRSERKDIKN